jgi:thermitase
MLLFFYLLSLTGMLVLGSIWLYYRRNEDRSPSIDRLYIHLITLAVVFFLLACFTSRHDAWRLGQSAWTDLFLIALLSGILSGLRIKKGAFLSILTGTGLLLICVLASIHWNSGPGAVLNPSYGDDWEVLIELKEGEHPNSLRWRIWRYGLLLEPAFALESPNESPLQRYYAVEIPKHWEHRTETIREIIQRHPAVAYSELNEMLFIHPILSSSVESSDSPYGLNDPELGKQWSFEAMQLDGFFDFFAKEAPQPEKRPLLAILDTGIDGTHEDLEAHYRSTKKSYDRDKQGHGTHCAGIAAAVSNNGIGIASIFPSAGLIEITSIRVLNDFGMGTQRQIIQGMIQAADAGADVVSMSLGGRSKDPHQRAYREAVQYCNNAGAIVVVAAGNDGGHARDIAPAKVPGVIVVSAVDTLLNRASFSNRVEGIHMALSAPGVAIYSTLPDNQYAAFSGTSMAAPQVAAAVALLRVFDPEIDTKTAFELLRGSGWASNQPLETGAVIRPGHALKMLLHENVKY